MIRLTVSLSVFNCLFQISIAGLRFKNDNIFRDCNLVSFILKHIQQYYLQDLYNNWFRDGTSNILIFYTFSVTTAATCKMNEKL